MTELQTNEAVPQGSTLTPPVVAVSLKKLTLSNYKLFRNAELRFSDNLTVLIGENGKGKTSILEALAKHLSWLAARMIRRNSKGSDLSTDNICALDKTITHASVSLSYDRNIGHTRKSMTAILAEPKPGIVEQISSDVVDYTDFGEQVRLICSQNENASLPLFAYYSIERTGKMRTEKTQESGGNASSQNAFSAFAQSALIGIGKEFKFWDFQTWFIRQSKIAANSEKNDKSLTAEKHLSFIKQAVTASGAGIEDVYLSMEQGFDDLRVKINGISLAFNQLSDGQRLIAGLFSDIASRLIQLNPGLSNPFNGSGIVLIDEVELHLHPRWQQVVLPNLLKTFPNLQFVVTTHSPQVLSSILAKNIRVLTDRVSSGSDDHPVFIDGPKNVQTKGVSSADILTSVMQTQDFPDTEERGWMDSYCEALERGDEKSAEDYLQKVKNHFGRSSSEVASLELFNIRKQLTK